MVSAVKIRSQKQCQKMKNLPCLKNLMQRLQEVIKRKTSLGNIQTKIMAFMTIAVQTVLMKMMKTNIILEKRASLIIGHFFVNGAHSILQDTFNEGVQHIIEKNPDIDTEEAEEETFDKLEPRYRAEAIGQYKAFLKLSKAMKKDPLHKKITDTAKRLRDEDEFDEDDALRYAIKKQRYLLDGKLEEFDPPTYSLGEDNESDSLQQSSGSKYARSQLQQNNIGPRHTQSQLPKRPWIDA